MLYPPKPLEDFALRNMTSVAIDQLCALFLLSYWSHQISMLECLCLGGQTSHMSPVMPQHLINHPMQLFWDPSGRKGGTEERRKEERGSWSASVEWECLVCMWDGRQCIKRWQLSHSSLNKSGETLAGCALTLIIHLNNCCRSLLPKGGCSSRQAAMGVGNMRTDVALLDFSFVNV